MLPLHLHVLIYKEKLYCEVFKGVWDGFRWFSISMLVLKFIKSDTHLFLCSCVLGVGWWWGVGVGVYAPSSSPCSNLQKEIIL